MTSSKISHLQSLIRWAAPAALLLSLIACGETAKQNSGAEELTTRSQSSSALDSMALPKASWQNHLELIRAIDNLKYNGITKGYMSDDVHCPNFDIDANDKIQLSYKKSTNKYMGDGGILSKVAMLVSIGTEGLALYQKTGDLHSLAGANAKRSADGIAKYAQCLQKKFSALGELKNWKSLYDLNFDQRVDSGDSFDIISAMSDKFLPLTKYSPVAARFTEKFNNHLKICYGIFKFANETEPRRYQIECGLDGSSVHYLQLPQLTVEKSGRQCVYKDGSTLLARHNLRNTAQECGVGPSR